MEEGNKTVAGPAVPTGGGAMPGWQGSTLPRYYQALARARLPPEQLQTQAELVSLRISAQRNVLTYHHCPYILQIVKCGLSDGRNGL